MNTIYSIRELQSPSFFQKLIKKSPELNAYIEVNNLLATKIICDIKIEEIEEISTRYKLDLKSTFSNQFKELYLIYLKYCLTDSHLTENELQDLNHLKQLLALNNQEVSELHNRLATAIYKMSYNEVINDGQIDKNEQEFLDTLQKQIQLPEELANKISVDARKILLDKQLEKIIEDERISPDEWKEFNSIAKNLNIQINIDDATKSKLEKLKQYWLIENSDLPEISVQITLPKNEKCYYTTNVEWLENRTVTKRINYGGPSFRLKIMKGVYYNAGSAKVQRITSEELISIDHGQLFITNKRLIFIGLKKNTNIQLNKILSITPFRDGIGIDKESGKSPILKTTINADIMAMILARVINDHHN
jgi:hypothetical protein